MGLSFDFKNLGLEGFSFFINYVRGQEARDTTTGDSLPDQDEFDITIDYRFEKGPLRGFWLRMRAAFVDFNRDGGAVNNYRVNLSHDFSLL